MPDLPKPADERARRNKSPVAMKGPAAGRAGGAPRSVGYNPSTRADSAGRTVVDSGRRSR